MKHYFNKEAFIEGLSCTLFACALFYLIITGKYLLFIRPRMKIYLYFSAVVMIVWAISCFRRIPIPQYKMRLNRFLVLVVPMIAMFLPYTAIKASQVSISSSVQNNQTDTQQSDAEITQNSQQNAANTQDVQNTSDNASGTSSQNGADNSADNNQQSTDTASQNNGQQNSQGQTAPSTQSYKVQVPSGLDTENKTITITDEEFYQWILQLNYYPDKYEGYTLHIHGTVYREDTMEENQFAVTRLVMSCCVADVVNCGPLCFYDNASELTQDAWVNVTGTYHYDKHKGMELTVTDIEDAEPSEDEYVYPVY